MIRSKSPSLQDKFLHDQNHFFTTLELVPGPSRRWGTYVTFVKEYAGKSVRGDGLAAVVQRNGRHRVDLCQ